MAMADPLPERKIDDSHVFYRDVKKRYPCIVRGEGVYLYDTDGKRYLDGCSGSLVANIGHGVKEIAQVMSGQAATIAFAHLSRFTSEPIMELSRRVAKMAPGSLSRCYFVSGGSEATESALKFARQYFVERDSKTSKYKVIARKHSFHGNTIGALSMSGDALRRRKYAPLLLPFRHIPAPYCYRCEYGLSYPGCGALCAHELERAIKMEGPENVMAFIAEPVAGAAAGAFVPPPEYYPIVREICDRYDVLFIADEVMCGMGRTGANFAIEHWGVVPDIICVAKGLSAGYIPLGAMVVKEEIWEVLYRGSGKFVHGHTYGGNPLACAVGVAVLDFMKEHDLVAGVKEKGEYLMKALEPLKENPIVGDVRGKGLMIGVELVKDKATKEPFDQKLGVAEKATMCALEKGLVVYPHGGAADGIRGDHFLVGPPFVISKAEMDELAAILREALDEVARQFS